MNAPPILSVVIPTHNRSDLLQKALDALACQETGRDWTLRTIEVIVVADTCDDDTIERVTAYADRAPYPLRVLSHRARCAAATRNLGAAHARGRFLLFLDDDVIAQPQLVQAHVTAQRPREDGPPHRVVLGYSKPIIPPEPSWWQYEARRWWEDRFREMARPGHRFTYQDLFSGNMSIPTPLFHRVGEFDASITGRLEDYELGMRLIEAGVRFHFEPQALGYHHENSDLDRWLHRLRQEGVAHVQIGRRHPELVATLFELEQPRSRQRRHLWHLAFVDRKRGDRLDRRLRDRAARHERLGLRRRWQRVLRLLREYNYWRGVATVIEKKQDLAAWLQEAPMFVAVSSDAPFIDLGALPPPDVLDQVLQQSSRRGIRVRLDGVELMDLPPQPGAESLRLESLYYALQERAERQFIPALAMHLVRSGTGPSSFTEESLLCLSSSPRSI